MNRTLLGGLSPSSFLTRHWQKQPLLIRGAIPEFKDLLTLRGLIALSRDDACEARLVVSESGQYEVFHGPLSPRIVRDLPENNWTLLVQGVNHACSGARELLHRFSFLPYARLDDVMVSYAAPGGGVGPHFDSYDVFLLQGAGQRRWEVSAQSNLEFIPDADLKLLKRFRADGSCVVERGDMLYLPPRFAHNGTAVHSCMTYSIGFRAAAFEELKTQFLAYLDDCLHLKGQYRDPQLRVTQHPAQLGNDLISQVASELSRIRWDHSDIADFLGRYLSEPKPHIVLRRPPALDYRTFCRRAQADGVEVHPALPLLFRGRKAFLNGEVHDIHPDVRRTIVQLADQRRLAARQVRDGSRALRTLYSWYGSGYIQLGQWGQT